MWTLDGWMRMDGGLGQGEAERSAALRFPSRRQAAALLYGSLAFVCEMKTKHEYKHSARTAARQKQVNNIKKAKSQNQTPFYLRCDDTI